MAADHSNGDELMVSVRSVMGSDDESMVTDANKNDVMCSKVRQYLVEDGHAALEAVAQGFRSLDLADHLEHFSGVKLAALFCGEQYVHVDSLIQCFKFDDEQQDTAGTKGFLETFVRSMSRAASECFLPGSPINCPCPGLISGSHWRSGRNRSSQCCSPPPVICSCRSATPMKLLQTMHGSGAALT